MSDYRSVIESKQWKAPACGFDPTFMPSMLFDWQQAVVRWAPVVEQLRASPGQWFKVANIDRPARSTASIRTSLRSAGLKFVTRTVEGGADIYAMYPGEEVTA